MAQEPNHQARFTLLAEQRTQKLKANQSKAKEYAQSGDELTAAGSYLQASYFYADAVRLWTTHVDFHVKLTTAYVQAKQFEQAALTATRALSMNPKHIEARYQRGLARLEQGLLKAAQIDFETILTHHPSHIPSRNALARVQLNFCSLNKVIHITQPGSSASTSASSSGAKSVNTTSIVSDDSSSDLDFGFPDYDEVELELVDISDSEECGHEGNGVPCRYYNRNGSGCMRGLGCKFMHAPDKKSVRDTLGRNVCLYHLLGSCKFGDAKCVYSHEKEWLPEIGWWNNDAQIERMKKLLEMEGRDAKERRHLVGKLKGSSGQMPASGKTRNGKKPHRYTRQRRGRSKPSSSTSMSVMPPTGGGTGDSDEDELEERMANFGFSAAELGELMCQGVKPWDDDAWDVLHALESM